MNENRIFIHFEPLAKSQKKEHLGVGTPMIFSTQQEIPSIGFLRVPDP